MLDSGGKEALPTSQICFHCLRRRGDGDSKRRGTSMAEMVKTLPARALLPVRPIVCASRIDIGTSAILIKVRSKGLWMIVELLYYAFERSYMQNACR